MKQEEKNKDYKIKYEKSKIHMYYWICILSFLSICLFTVRASGNENLSSEIAFGATLSGIILSVIAIIMTIVGETKSENTKDTLVNVSTDLEEIVETIKSSTEKLENLTSFEEGIKDIQDNVRLLCNGYREPKTSINEDQKKDILSIDYIKVYELYVAEVDDKLKMYTAATAYFLMKAKADSIIDASIKFKEVLKKHDKSFFEMYYTSAIGSLMPFMPVMKIKLEDNKFYEYIKKCVENNYLDLKLKIDDLV